MISKTIWKITICRKGTGCQIVEYDAILKRAWHKLVHNDLNKPYLAGINPHGERFGPDLTKSFGDCFDACKRKVWRHKTVKFAKVISEDGKCSVAINRFDNVEESYEH